MNKLFIVFLAIAIVISIFAAALYFAIPGISIGILAKKYDLNISYASALFVPHIGTKEMGGFKVDITLKDVRISKKGAVASAYENIGALISAPFDGALKYREINGVLRPRPKHIFIDKLIAEGDDIKVSLKGDFFYDEDKADLDMVIGFSKNMLKKVPRELSDTVLRESGDGWSSLTVNLKGSFKSPSIELTGRLFRLSIKEVSGS